MLKMHLNAEVRLELRMEQQQRVARLRNITQELLEQLVDIEIDEFYDPQKTRT